MTHELKETLDWLDRNILNRRGTFIDANADACAVVSGFYNITKTDRGFDALFIARVERIGLFETLDAAKHACEQHQAGVGSPSRQRLEADRLEEMRR